MKIGSRWDDTNRNLRIIDAINKCENSFDKLDKFLRKLKIQNKIKKDKSHKTQKHSNKSVLVHHNE